MLAEELLLAADDWDVLLVVVDVCVGDGDNDMLLEYIAFGFSFLSIIFGYEDIDGNKLDRVR
ncbi:hypothetical protein DERF_006103 [Dermatophagoides farinae]|uniref:Uncharacterized protein n=1 Tax=Dermatophagoides farinae TaxID=6954 RepID=A0A922I9N8_DERFA|nr:hypothetical protein DERF_006103 [Dermatophagoides farinae]